jgi:hypothetical protein
MEEIKVKTDGDGLAKRAEKIIEKEKQMISRKIEEQKAAGPFTTEKLLGVAMLGAFGSLLLYYVYYSMPEETRSNVTNKIKNSAKQYANEVFPQLMKQGVERM